MSASPRLLVPSSLDEALEALSAGMTPLGGATWIMRAPLRGERMEDGYVAVGSLPALSNVVVEDGAVRIGAGVTHADLARAAGGVSGLRVLADAAGKSANPAVRGVATVGGNLSAAAFPAADLVPALLCLDAEVVLAQGKERRRIPLVRYLGLREEAVPGRVLLEVVVPRVPEPSAHARLTLRAAGDYPVAIVSLSLALAADATVARARVAVGSVEPVARRWPELEDALTGEPLDADASATAATSLADAFRGRDGVEAPGWYRKRVLPTLVRRAVAAVADNRGGHDVA